ncbi:MAG: VacJ family lipoprotein [Proteobacteria bacterium]|nr:VacJ family lipoprotein [Pseudomonadota bacterium]
MKIVNFILLLFIFFCQPLFSVAAESPEPLYAIPNLLDDEINGEEVSWKEEQGVAVYDPLESMNRFFFDVNDRLYIWVVNPLTKGYRRVLPYELRESLGNFFLNISFPVNFLNAVLQGDVSTTIVLVERFVINSTIGVCGLADVAASEFDIGPRRADFGQTLGRWGIGEGVFIYWPLVGPSNLRDSFGLAADTFAKPLPYIYDDRVIDLAIYSTERVNVLSLHPGLYEDLKRYSLDPYIAARQAYTEYRRGLLVRD